MEAKFRTDMQIPTRPAPTLPGSVNSRKNQRSSAALDLMSIENDPFTQSASLSSKMAGKKKPPPRPPPPKAKVGNQNKASLFDIFGRNKESPRGKVAATAIVKPMPPVPGSDVATDSLIDLYSPSCSPTLSKSSSSGIIHFNNYSKCSHIESGFEDDFTSNATTPSNDPFSDSADPFSPVRKPSAGDLLFELSNEDPKAKRYAPVSVISSTANFSKPTIIRPKAKPTRPPPPKSVKANNVLGMSSQGSFNSQMLTPVKTFDEGFGSENWSSPPMPNVPPPPPPPEAVQVLLNGPPIPPRPPPSSEKVKKPNKTPYCIAEYTYEGTHDDDLSFKAGDVITLTSEVNADWLKGKLSGNEGIFPRNYVNVVVPLGREEDDDASLDMTAIALYNFSAETWDDLDFQEGEEIKVLRRVNEDWLYGECNGRRGQFPENYVQDITPLVGDEP